MAALALAGALFLAAPWGLVGQTPDGADPGEADPSRRGRVGITEFVLALPGDDDLPVSPSAEWGLLWDLPGAFSLGAVGTLRHEDGLQVGLEPRLRWWSGETTSIDVGGGFRTGDRRYSDDLVLVAHGGISLWDDLAGLMIHLEYEDDFQRESNTVQKVVQPYVGGFVGSGIGLLGTGLAVAAWTVVILLL
jgi:hypothetical protein